MPHQSRPIRAFALIAMAIIGGAFLTARIDASEIPQPFTKISISNPPRKFIEKTFQISSPEGITDAVNALIRIAFFEASL